MSPPRAILLLAGLLVLGLGLYILLDSTGAGPDLAPAKAAPERLEAPPEVPPVEPSRVEGPAARPFSDTFDPTTPTGLAGAVPTEHGFALRGVVLAGEVPVPGAEVALVFDVGPGGHVQQLGDRFAVRTTGPDGSFFIPDLEPGVRLVLRVTHPDYCAHIQGGIDAARPETLHQIVHLVPGLGVSGIVVLRDGRTAEGVEVAALDLAIQAFDPDDRVEKTVVAGPDGRFELRALRAGMKQIQARRGDLARTTSEIFHLDRPRTDLRLEMGAGSSIRGVVVGPDGASPVAGARVVARALGRSGPSGTPLVATIRSDAAGAFSIPSLPEGSFEIWAAAEGYLQSVNAVVNAGAPDVLLVLRAAPRALGRLVESGSGRPVASATIYVTANPDLVMSGPGRSFRVRDPEGRFAIALPAAGTVHLVARAEGLADGVLGPLAFGEGQILRDLELRMDRGARLLGSVRRRDGAPVAGAQITVEKHRGAPQDPAVAFLSVISQQFGVRLTARSGEDGAFVVDGLRPGLYQVAVTHERYSSAERRTVEIPAGATEVPIEPMVTEEGATLRGIVRRKDGGPDAGARLALQGVAAHLERREAMTDSEGRFQIGGIVPGDYRLLVLQREGTPSLLDLLQQAQARVLSLRPGEVLDLDL
jgi:hypothetical protein